VVTSINTPPPAVRRLGGHNGHNGRSHNLGGAGDPAAGEAGPPARRNSIFPFLLDLGVVLALFGLIIIRPIYHALAGDIVLGLGVLLALTALAGWIREARAEYSRLQD
jgi:hypothetical protein